jgi:hypothetical protein
MSGAPGEPIPQVDSRDRKAEQPSASEVFQKLLRLSNVGPLLRTRMMSSPRIVPWPLVKVGASEDRGRHERQLELGGPLWTS